MPTTTIPITLKDHTDKETNARAVEEHEHPPALCSHVTPSCFYLSYSLSLSLSLSGFANIHLYTPTVLHCLNMSHVLYRFCGMCDCCAG